MANASQLHIITETEELSHALDVAATIWPSDKDNRTKLLSHIIDEGVAVITTLTNIKAQNRLAAINNAAGSMPGVWPANWREELRDEWPG